MSLRLAPGAARAAIANAASVTVGGVQRHVRPPEPLEARLMWSVSYDANGYTVVAPDINSRVVYISSSAGSDTNSGLSASAPVATIAHAETLLRNGMPDQLLFKRGDVFHDYFGYNWQLSGQDAADPMVIGAYGTGARPLIDSGANTWAINVGGTTPISYLDVLGISFEPLSRDPTSSTFVAPSTSSVAGTTGFRWYSPGGTVLIQDCTFNYYMYNLDIETWAFSPVTPPSGFTVSRDVISNSYSVNSHSEGLFASDIGNLTVTQCVFDHDGWNATISGAGQQGYNHDIYDSFDVTNVVITNCVLADASFAGIMARSGGVIDNDLFVNDPIAVSYGNANGASSTTGGVTGQLVGNAVVGDAALGTLAWGEGFEIGNTTGVLVAGNVFTADTQHYYPAIELTMATATLNPAVAVGENNVTIEGNVVNGYGYGIALVGSFVPGGTGLYALNNLKVLGNDFLNATTGLVSDGSAYTAAQETFAGNRYYDPAVSTANWAQLLGANIGIAAWLGGYDTTGTILTAPLPYADVTRTVATYDLAVDAAGTVADFLSQAAQISPSNYRTQYMAQAVASYVQAGFTADTTAPTALAAVATVNAASLGVTAYTFTVTYTDNALLNASTVGAGDVLVTGPNGFSQTAAFVSDTAAALTTAGGQQVVATYKITPPAGAWATGQDGTYTASLLPGAVADAAGNLTAAATLATFTVDLTPPTATLVAAPITTAGGTSYAFTITYADASGINSATLDSTQVQVTSATGYGVAATLTGTAVAPNGKSVVASYSIAPADGAWSTSDAGTYAVSLAAGDPVRDGAGNAAAAGTLGTFAVQIGTSPASTATAGAVSGYAYVDANANGVYDAREVPLAGVTVFLDLAGTGRYAAGDPTAVTAADGSYTFTGVTPGKYAVVAVPPTGYQATAAASQTVTLAAGGTVANVDFGFQVTPATISKAPARSLISLHSSGLTVGTTSVAPPPPVVVVQI